MGIFDFLFGKRTNKDIEKWEKRRSIPPMGGTPIKKVPLKEGLKDDTANEPVKKNKFFSKKSAADKWVEEGGDMTDMMREMAEEWAAKGMIKKISEKEKKEINEKVYDKLSKSQIKDRQVYASIRAYAELMKIDGNMDPNEMMLLGKFSKDEQKKLSGEYNQDSEEFKFVWAKEENVFECLKTFNKRQAKSFFHNLFAIAAVDGEVGSQEIAFLHKFYDEITDNDKNDGLEQVTKMFQEWRDKNGI